MRKLISILALAPLVAAAHPGDHHAMSFSAMIAHYISQPDHLAMLLAVIVGGFALAAKLGQKN